MVIDYYGPSRRKQRLAMSKRRRGIFNDHYSVPISLTSGKPPTDTYVFFTPYTKGIQGVYHIVYVGEGKDFRILEISRVAGFDDIGAMANKYLEPCDRLYDRISQIVKTQRNKDVRSYRIVGEDEARGIMREYNRPATSIDSKL